MNRDAFSRLWSRLCPPEPFDFPTEAAFLKDYARRFAGHRRASAAIAEMTWLAFVGWEYIFYGSQSGPLSSVLPAGLKLEIAGASVLALAIWQWAVWQLYKPVSAENDRHATTVICIAIVTLYWVQLGIMQIAPYPYNYLYYYIGLLVVLLFLFGFFRLLARPTLRTTALCVGASAVGFALPQNQG